MSETRMREPANLVREHIESAIGYLPHSEVRAKLELMSALAALTEPSPSKTEGEATPCYKCKRPVYGYEPEFCCNERDCACMGYPIEPPLCDDCDMSPVIAPASEGEGEKAEPSAPKAEEAGEPWTSDNGRQAYEVGLDLAALDDPTGVIEDAIDLLATWQPDAPPKPASHKAGGERDTGDNPSADALDDICKIIGAPDWEYPGQVVRDVAKVVGISLEEMVEMIAAPASPAVDSTEPIAQEGE